MPLHYTPNVYKDVKLEQTQPDQPSQKISPMYKIFALAGQGADLGSTLYAMNNGFHESNPIMPKGELTNSLVKGGAMIASLYAIKHLEKNHPQAAKSLAVVTGLAGVIPASINTAKLSK